MERRYIPSKFWSIILKERPFGGTRCRREDNIKFSIKDFHYEKV